VWMQVLETGTALVCNSLHCEMEVSWMEAIKQYR